MQPNAGEVLQFLTDFIQIVEGTGSGGAQGGRHEKRNKSLQFILLHGLEGEEVGGNVNIKINK